MRRKLLTYLSIYFLLNGQLIAGENLKTDSNGNISYDKKSEFEGKTDDTLMNSITTIAIGAISSRMLLKYRPLTSDAYVASAAGTAYLAGEVVATTKYKKASERKEANVTVNSNGQQDEAQVSAINDLQENAEEAKKAIDTKKKLQQVASIGYLVAGSIALSQQFSEEAMNAACMNATALAQTELGACVSTGTATAVTGVGATEAASCGACSAKIATQATEFQAYVNSRKVTKGSSAQSATTTQTTRASLQAQFEAPCTGATAQAINFALARACGGAFSLHKMLESFSPTGGIGNRSLENFSKLIAKDKSILFKDNSGLKTSPFEYMIKELIPTANAGTIGLLGMGAGATAAMMVVDKQLSTAIDIQMHVPLHRSIMWFGLAAMSAGTSKQSDKISDDIQQQIEKIKPIAAKMNNLGQSIKAQNIYETKIDITEQLKNKSNTYSFSENGTDKMPCLLSNSSSGCKSIDEEYKKVATLSGLDPQLTKMGSAMTQFGDGIQGSSSISGSTLNSANSLMANAVGLKKLKDDQIKKYRLNNSGFDLDAEASKFSSGVNSKIASILKEKGQDPQKFLASISGFSPESNLNKSNPTSTQESQKDEAKKASTANSIAPGKKKEAEKFNFVFKDDQPQLGLTQEASDNEAEDFEFNTPQITKDRDKSIFQIISNRYIRSGYPKLLEEIKSEPTVTETAQ